MLSASTPNVPEDDGDDLANAAYSAAEIASLIPVPLRKSESDLHLELNATATSSSTFGFDRTGSS